MSLTCDLYVNGERIGVVYARRIGGDGVGQDDVNEYDCALNEVVGVTVWRGRVQHRYGDGAWGLVQRVLQAAGEVE